MKNSTSIAKGGARKTNGRQRFLLFHGFHGLSASFLLGVLQKLCFGQISLQLSSATEICLT
jgi:hypothetical protein